MDDVEFENMWLQRLYEILGWLSKEQGLSFSYGIDGEGYDALPEGVVRTLMSDFSMGDDDVFELAELRDVLTGYKREPKDPSTCNGVSIAGSQSIRYVKLQGMLRRSVASTTCPEERC